MTLSAESAQPLSSALACERQAAVDEAVARAEAEYVNIDTCKMSCITSLPSTNPNQALDAQQLMHSSRKAKPTSS